MPINSYVSPLVPSATNTNTLQPPPPSQPRSSSSSSDAAGTDPIRAPSMQRLNSLNSTSLSSIDRRRRGSSFGNLFSSITASFRQQAGAVAPLVAGNANSTSYNQDSNPIMIPPPTQEYSPQSISSSYGSNHRITLSHEQSTATIRPSLADSRRSSAGNNNNITASNQSLSLLMSPTVTDMQQQFNEASIRSSTSLSREVLGGHELLETDELMDENDELLEDTEDQARTRQNSTAIVPLLAESVNDKRESDGSFSIRLTPFIDHSSSSPALYFSPLIRRLKPGMKLPIGRYTERNREAAQAPHGSSAAIVFKSKVVSRTHLEIIVDDHGNWYIRDLKSSSGTFLNHIRLSPAGAESEDCMVGDGDILQLGMDFRGGSEEIFRCVKVRVELNKSWKRKTHKFNKDAHKKLLGEETECCICLNDLKVGDSIFISPCSHSWHYKCIRPLLVRNYPQFHCPNCRSITDLEEDDDDDD